MLTRSFPPPPLTPLPPLANPHNAHASLHCGGSVDNGPVVTSSNGSTTVSLTGLAHGTVVSVLFNATSPVGNSNNRTVQWTVDLLAPNVTLSTRPLPLSTVRSPQFGMDCSKALCSYSYNLVRVCCVHQVQVVDAGGRV